MLLTKKKHKTVPYEKLTQVMKNGTHSVQIALKSILKCLELIKNVEIKL